MPTINHNILKLPGIFRSLEATNGYTWNGKNIYLDQLLTAPARNPLFIPPLALIPSILGRLKGKHKVRLHNYSLNSSCKLKMPCFTVVALDYDPGIVEETIYIEDHPLKINYRAFTQNRLYQHLNKMNNMDYFKQPMSGLDYGEWAQDIAFASNNYAKDYIRKNVELFTKIEKIKNIPVEFIPISQRDDKILFQKRR